MNPPLSALNGKALHSARQSMDPQFEHIDSGEDEIFNHILWFLAKREIPYPSRFTGKVDDKED